ncbi:flavin reductase family protein [Phreatobacter stygius]|uniref:Flavin reductase family protein n=1 Tax=Phreatobacter stygius TaxID=1940610 RepID=A0A4D7B227_9HYPH|nr:flavin reductase family protein [Phreatobacter stygius]QCI67634.1 flavin reductase family protein [Phreatobacter stygius]
MDPAHFSQDDLRRAFGTFLTGVTVVTTRDDTGAPRGMTANSFTSVSLDPPLVLVCIGKRSSNIGSFQEAGSFAVNILGREQTGVATLFASRGADRFAGVDCRQAATGAPILDDCLSWFDCLLHQRVDAGDHLILIGEVQDFGVNFSEPLGFCRGSFISLSQ